jgi:hypothetical protein
VYQPQYAVYGHLLSYCHQTLWASPPFATFNALRINHANTGRWLPIGFLASAFNQGFIEPFPCPIIAPFPEVITAQGPGRQIVGHLLPLVSRFGDVEQRIKNAAQEIFSFTLVGQDLLDNFPGGITGPISMV